MFEEFRIRIFGDQPVAKITVSQLDCLIRREFSEHFDEVKAKLKHVKFDTSGGQRRISAAILQLANKDLRSLDHYINMANNDYRDVLVQAEYPECAKPGIQELSETEKKRIYLNDWKQYSEWLNSKA